jgi:hypothetical protein
MKYMLLMQATQSHWASFGAMPPDDIKAHIQFMMKLNTDLAASGELVGCEGLSGPEQAKLVRAREGGGAPIVTDGPFPEAKEFLAGYWILDCKTPERAVELAARISAAPGKGGVPMNFPVELRPVGVAPEVG